MRWGIRSLPVRLMLAISGVAIASIGSVTFLFVERQRQGFIEELERHADLTLDSLALAAVRIEQKEAGLSEAAILPSADMTDVQSRGAIISSDGVFLAGVGDAVRDLPLSIVEDFSLESGTRYVWEEERLLAGRRVNALDVAIGDTTDPGIVLVEISTSALKQHIQQVWLDAIQVALGASALSTLLALMLSRTITGSLKQMVVATERIASGKFSERLPTRKGGYELSVLAQSFNQMASHLQKTIARQRALVRYSLDAIVVLDCHGNVIELNPVAERMFACRGDDVCGQCFSKWAIVAPWSEQLQMDLVAVVRGDTNCLLGRWQEIEAQRLNGTRFPAEMSITNADVQGDLLFTVTLRDITERRNVAIRLQQSEARFRQIVRSAPIGIALVNADTHLIQQVNPALCAIVGSEEASLLGIPFETLGLVLPTPYSRESDMEDGSSSSTFDLKQAGSPETQLADLSTPHSEVSGLRQRGLPILQVPGFTEQLDGSEKATASAAHSTDAHSTDSRSQTSRDGLEAAGEDLDRGRLTAAYNARDDGAADGAFEDFETTVPYSLSCQSEQSYCHPDGREIWIGLTVTALADAGEGAVSLVMLEDITQHKQVEFRLRHEALHDPLTGLANRALLLKRLSRACDRFHSFDAGHAFAVLFLDCDRFKTINDTLGHEVGDRLLISVARRLEDCVREGDTVARLGGDEFTVLLKHIREPEEAVRVADRILDALSQPLDLGSHQLAVTASIGIVNSHPQYRTAEAILKDADAAMYRAKTRGRAQHAVFAGGPYSE